VSSSSYFVIAVTYNRDSTAVYCSFY